MKKIFWHSMLLATAILLTACGSGSSDTIDVRDLQENMLSIQEQALLTQREGHTDLYFVGFAGYASQDVFMKEVVFSQNLFDTNFDTAGRSIALVNNSNDVYSYPLATLDNLTESLQQVKNKMDVDEDIAFIFLTSHGSSDNSFNISNPPFYDEHILPNAFKEVIDTSGIKWKVIVVSACYSGEFVNVLADETTMVMSASDPYQTSFGCSNTADFTYFGEAYFKNALSTTTSFIDAFSIAEIEITAKESALGFDNSNPQLSVSSAMIEKLNDFQVDLSNNVLE